MTAARGSDPLNLPAIEAKLRVPVCGDPQCAECQYRNDAFALVGALRDARAALTHAHDAYVVFERKALELPTDEITITGALLKELRKLAAVALQRVRDD